MNFMLYTNIPSELQQWSYIFPLKGSIIFNPVTKIKFDVASKLSYTSLKSFDITGREITELVYENLNPAAMKLFLIEPIYPAEHFFQRYTRSLRVLRKVTQ